ncbi:MAG: 5'/3'-nucleotidase SurE [Calditrichia bacterium]|nr:5'/3'-nucleotidase SurE [Calditrichota bacterium]MCB0267218.1 5'/3'-nucleotidase SurE [Calditrichota bacterium]MCB0286905.1 5'/3'-nucleotidase SurE [Calditrichota bacterium]MCB9067620.1 5'/3'-nucleotidase SurE [Calditrichia bacterium]
MSERPKILVTNDDGIFSHGIWALCNAMKSIGEPYVVAPDSEKSAVGHAITLSDPLRVAKVERHGEFFGWSVNGTPADCVKLGVKGILEFKPDLVVSGINQGSNAAVNVIYSGTVSAATEGAIMGIPSIAFSLTSFTNRDFSGAAEVAKVLADAALKNGIPEDTLLSVNIPALPLSEIKGIKITRQGRGRFEEFFEKRTDLTNRTYYWLGGKKLVLDTDDDVDEVAISRQYVAVTPLHLDLTQYRFLAELRNWQLDLPQ